MKKKWILLIAALAIVAMISLSACDGLTSLTGLQSTGGGETATTDGSAANGGASNGSATDGGAGASTISEEDVAAASEEVQSTLSAMATSDYLESDWTTVTEAQACDTSTEEGAIVIDLDTLSAESVIEGAKYKDNVLTVMAAGTYVLTGTLNGAVIVDKNIEGTVRIVLAGATIKTLDSQSSAAIVFSKSDDALRILTVADGTVNEISDSVGDTAADGDGAAIQAKKSSLVINGTGTLVVNAVGEEANGIKVKNSLTILSATIRVTAVKNGIKADTLIRIKDANVTVTAGNDGIKTDIEPTTEEEALAYAADPDAGCIYVENSTLTVTASDDGIAANSRLFIANRSEDVITVTTNGGAPQSVTERSADAADGKALKVSGIVLEDEEGNETDYPATYDGNYALVITGGTFVIGSNDDAIHSKGNVLIADGDLTIASGDDGVHAEYLTKITGGSLTVTKSYEGIEGGAVEITGGEIDVTAVDDGVNAANADLTNYTYYILITGGTLTVNCSGDGIDSNGKLLIAGGDVKVFGPTNGGNSALDSEKGTTISGGTVIATCREAMDSVGSTQYMVIANVSISAGTTLTLKDSSGETVLTFTAPKACQNVTVSTPDLKAGSYTLTYGSSSVTLTATTGSSGGMGGMGGMGGPVGGQGGMGRGGRPSAAEGETTPPTRPDGSEMPEGSTPPELPDGEMPQEGMTPPEIPDGGMTPPELPDGETPQEGMMPPQMPNGGQGGRPFGRGGYVPSESLERDMQ